MKLIVISSSKSIENETVLVSQLFEEGLRTFHLRKHNMSTREMKEYINQIPAKFHNRIYLHTHHQLALTFNIKGIHLTSKHKKQHWKTFLNLLFIRLRRPLLEVTTSVKTLGEVYEEEPQFKYNYIFLSPIFDHAESKFQGAFSDYSLKVALHKSAKEVIARGGVDIPVIAKTHELGFNGLAFYNCIWKDPNPVSKFNDIVYEFQRQGISIE
jgi:thiamine-phosphate pyrophosphorylase